MLEFLTDRFRANERDQALVRGEEVCLYGALLEEYFQWCGRLTDERVPRGAVVALEADFSAGSTAALLALVEHECIVVPVAPSSGAQRGEYRRLSQAELSVTLEGGVRIEATGVSAAHPLYGTLRREGHPGLVLFSSGSTGNIKGAVHDFLPLLDKFRIRRSRFRTLAFLLFDHIGGLNTLLHTLSNGGCLVVAQDRSPEAVCAAIEKHRVELLPASPTFLNLMRASEAYRRFDLGSLRTVTYGTEPMPEGTLRRLNNLLPPVRFQQTYGLSEVGILRSKSKADDSLWVKIGGEGYETRVVDGVLEIRAHSAMLGYLNAPSPFTDGWLNTGDLVEVDGEYLKFLGRVSEVINVGGEKVYPAEVESALEEMPGVEACAVAGEPHPLVGQIVAAYVRLSGSEPLEQFSTRMWRHCSGRLPRFKIPQKVYLRPDLHNERFKKKRASLAGTAEGGR